MWSRPGRRPWPNPSLEEWFHHLPASQTGSWHHQRPQSWLQSGLCSLRQFCPVLVFAFLPVCEKLNIKRNKTQQKKLFFCAHIWLIHLILILILIHSRHMWCRFSRRVNFRRVTFHVWRRTFSTASPAFPLTS